MATPGQCILIFPNLALDPNCTVSADSETNGDADNVLTERADSWWSPANFDSARYVEFDWGSGNSVKLNCVFIPHAYMSGVNLITTNWTIAADDTTTPPADESKNDAYWINTGAGASARNELSQPNVGLEAGGTTSTKNDRLLAIAANRWSSYLILDNAVSARYLRVTFTPVSPSSAVLRVPCIVPGWAFRASISWDGEWAPSVLVNGSIRRSFRFSMTGVHGYDAFSRWYRQILFRGLHQKWALIFAPSWEELHYETCIWGYMHDFKINMMRAIDDDVYLYSVSGRIVESLNSEGRPGA